MKRLLALTVALAFCGGCVTGTRTQSDEVKTYTNGKQIRGPRINLANMLIFQFLGIDLGINSSVEEPAVVAGSSVLSKTGLEAFNASVESDRGATNTHKAIGYKTKGLTTDVSTNAAPTVESFGSAGGKIIKEAVGNPLP